MKIKPPGRPINRTRFSTLWIGGTGRPGGSSGHWTRIPLLLIAVVSTLAIGFDEPSLRYGYEAVALLLAAGWCVARSRRVPLSFAVPLIGIALWGFGQLPFNATVYRFATLESALQNAALAATAWVAFCSFSTPRARDWFLHWLSWFGAAVAVVAVVAYFTSPGRILWIFPSVYPDIWGCFPSRNNFAQFLELAMPAALWLGLRNSSGVYSALAAAMLGAGLASASRAGAVVLILEALVLLLFHCHGSSSRRMAMNFGLAAILFSGVAGVGVLAGRFTASDPFEGRREIAHATVSMISARPWTGYGLGTFPEVYPGFAVFDAGRTVDHAHNDWLEWTAGGGVFFTVLWLAVAAVAAVPAWRSGWGLGVVGCFLHAAVDYPFARLGIAAWCFILIGILAAAGLREVSAQKH